MTVNVGSQSNTRLQQMDILVQGYQKQAEANEAQVNQLTEELGRYRIKCQEVRDAVGYSQYGLVLLQQQSHTVND